jgi:hypothetical protein
VVRNPQNLPPARARIVTADLGSADPAALQSAVDGADAVLLRLLRRRCRAEDEAAVAGLVQALERLVSADGDFAARIREFSNHL